MVLPGRIELTTSPLPRGCSTTELRQHREWAYDAEADANQPRCRKAAGTTPRPRGFSVPPTSAPRERRAAMARCDQCGNDYDKAFKVTLGDRTMTFDSFECAIQAMAPRCAYLRLRRHRPWG